jgi:hypothetical protein
MVQAVPGIETERTEVRLAARICERWRGDPALADVSG